VPSLDKKGPVIVAAELSNWYALNGHDVDLYYCKSMDPRVFVHEKVCVKKLNIAFFEKINSYDLIHSNSFVPDFISSVCSIFWKSPKYVTTVHNFMMLDFEVDYSNRVAQVLNTIWPRCLVRLNKVYISKAQQSYLEARYFRDREKSKSTHIYNPVSIKKELVQENDFKFIEDAIYKKKKILGVCSVLTKRKSVDVVIKTLSFLPEYFVLVIVGDGPERDNLEALVKNYGLVERVFFTGFINSPHSVIKKLDIFIFPSEVEAFGLSGVEAGLLGIPLIVSDIITFKEIYSEGKALFFSVGDPKELELRILESNLSLFDKTKISKVLDSQFSIEVIGNKYLDFYNEL